MCWAEVGNALIQVKWFLAGSLESPVDLFFAFPRPLRDNKIGQPASGEAGPAPPTVDGPALPGGLEPQHLRRFTSFQSAGWVQGRLLPAQPQAQVPAVLLRVILSSLPVPAPVS